MLLKVKYALNPETKENEIVSFVCLRSDQIRERDLIKNEILIPASSVPSRFYSRWFEYVLEGTTLVWSDKIVSRLAKLNADKK